MLVDYCALFSWSFLDFIYFSWKYCRLKLSYKMMMDLVPQKWDQYKNRRLEIFRNWMSDFEEILSIGTSAFQFFLVFFIHKKWKVPLNWGTACLFNHLLVHKFWMNWFIVLVQLIAAYWSKLTRSDFSFQDSIQLFYLKFITN